MNNSPIDVLLQIPVPRVDSAPAGPRARDESSAFDSHFRKASNPSSSSASPPTSATQSSRDSNAGRDAATAQPATRSNQAPQSSSETPPASDSSSTDEEQAKATDAEQEQEDNADEIVAVTAAAAVEQVAASDANGLAGDEIDSTGEPHENVAATTADEEQQPRAKDGKAATRANVSADSQAKQAAPHDHRDSQPDPQVSAENRDEKQQPTANQLESDAAANPADASDAQPESADRAGESSSKSRHADNTLEHAQANTTAAQPVVAASASAVEKAGATKKSAIESTSELASRKSDKKAGTRASVAPAEVSSAPTERPAAVAATASTDTPVAPAAIQSQPVAANVVTSATANSAAKPQDAQPASKQGFLSPFARLERGAHSARGASQSGATDGPRHVDPARFVSRVARAIHTAQERGGPLQLRLSPPELGAMRLELSLNQGTLTANIETENSSTRQLLIDNLPALRERLAEQNIKIERFDVDVRRDPSGNGENTAPQDRGQAEHHDRRPARNSAPRASAAAQAVDDPAPIRRNISNTSINVVA